MNVRQPFDLCDILFQRLTREITINHRIVNFFKDLR